MGRDEDFMAQLRRELASQQRAAGGSRRPPPLPPSGGGGGSGSRPPGDGFGNKFFNFIKQTGGNMRFTPLRLLTGLGLFVSLILMFMLVGYETIEGNERAVEQNWKEGVLKEVVTSGTRFYVPMTTKLYKYHIGTQKFIMGNPRFYKKAEEVDAPAYEITTGGEGKEQPAIFSVTLQYQLDPTKLVELHNRAQLDYESLIIKPALTRIISDNATTKTVLEFYSGQGRVNLQKAIEKAISETQALAEVGIMVETFVIDDITLDQNYVNEIIGRQLATQKKLRAIEEAKAAEEVAKRVQAEAEADKLKKIVEAEAGKQQRIKAAEAAQREVELAATAERVKKEQNAKGLLAEGIAQAKVDQARKTSRYAGSAGARLAAVEINQARVEMFKNFNVTGIIPEKAALTFIEGSSKNIVPTVNLTQPPSDTAGDADEGTDATDEN